MVDLGLISGWVKPTTIKIGIHSFPARRSKIEIWSVQRVFDRRLDSNSERSWLCCLLAVMQLGKEKFNHNLDAFASYLVALQKKSEKRGLKTMGSSQFTRLFSFVLRCLFRTKIRFQKKVWPVMAIGLFSKIIASWPRAVTRLSLKRKVWGSNLEPVKSGTMLPTASHRSNIFQNELCYSGAIMRRWALRARYTLLSNTASIMKDLIKVLAAWNVRMNMCHPGSM